MMKLKTYDSDDGLYISAVTGGYSHSFLSSALNFNGKKCEKTWSEKWVFLSGEHEIKSITRDKVMHPKIEFYELVDKSFASDKIPEKLSPEDVGRYYDDDMECYCWLNYEQIRGLYKEVLGDSNVIKENIDFEEESLGKINISNKDAPEKLSVRVDTLYGNSSEVDISSCVTYDELSSMLVPDLLIHKQPCSITSEQAYSVIRNHVKEHIDVKQAIITSDYDFCFNVKKLVSIKPYVKTTEERKANGRSYAKPRIHKRTIEHKQIDWFEMTTKKKRHGSYTPIEGFSGDSLDDLIANIKNYLDELMDSINCELKECSHCSGSGIVHVEKFKANER